MKMLGAGGFGSFLRQSHVYSAVPYAHRLDPAAFSFPVVGSYSMAIGYLQQSKQLL